MKEYIKPTAQIVDFSVSEEVLSENVEDLSMTTGGGLIPGFFP